MVFNSSQHSHVNIVAAEAHHETSSESYSCVESYSMSVSLSSKELHSNSQSSSNQSLSSSSSSSIPLLKPYVPYFVSQTICLTDSAVNMVSAVPICHMLKRASYDPNTSKGRHFCFISFLRVDLYPPLLLNPLYRFEARALMLSTPSLQNRHKLPYILIIQTTCPLPR